MNGKEITRYRRALSAMQTALDEEIARGQEGQKTVVLDQQAVGRLSRMDALQHQAMAKAIQARRNATAGRIRAALLRIDEGEYGFCVSCGDDIAPKRLNFDPTVARCISCATG